MPLLTPEQLQEIRQIVEDHHDAFVVNTVGPEVVAPEVLARLRDQGLVNVKVESVKDAYIYGQLMAMMQSSQIASMSYEQFKQHVRRNPIPLSEAEIHAVRMAQMNAGQYCKGLGNRVNIATGDILIEADAALRARTEGIIRDATALNIVRRETVQRLKSDLGWATKDWARDWARIAVTEKQTAMQRGVADHYRARYGGDVLVAKRPMPDACRHCKRVYLGPDGQPRIFKLRTLEENGTNVGRKANDWLAVVGTVHPHCQCQLIRVPAGWGFNEEGEMVPGGELGEKYEGSSDLALALLQEGDLQKAFKLQGHLDFQGLPVAIENRKGTTRKWKAPNGESGQTKMYVAYGYIKRTNGIDEDEVDVFVGPDPRAEMVYIVEQQIPETGLYDETKCMIGFPNQKQAEQTYNEHYDRPGFMLYTTAMDMDQFKRWLQETAPKKGEMMEKGETETTPPFRLVIPFQKARVPNYIGAATSRAGNRSPSPGTSANYIMADIPPRPVPQSLRDVGYRPDSRELSEHFYQDFEAENPLKVDKEVYHIQNPVRIVRPIKQPKEQEEAAAEAREGHEDRMFYLVNERIRNAGRPKNTADIDTEIYGLPEEAFQKGVTPIGGITPGGYRRVAKDKYVPVAKKKKPKREPVEKKPRRTWVWHKPGLPETTAKLYKREEDGAYNPVREKLHEKIIGGFLEGKSPAPPGQKKVAIVLMGGPASGKTTMVRRMFGEKFENMVSVAPDDIKEKMPEYQEALEFKVNDKVVSAKDASTMVHEESSDMASAVYKRALDQGLDMVIDGTGAKGVRHRDRIKALQEAGYHVHLMMPDVDSALATQRSDDRAEETGRWVPTGPPPPGTPNLVQKIYNLVPQNFEPLARLADEFALFDTTTFPPKVKWAGGRGQEDTVHDSGFLERFKQKVVALAEEFGSPLGVVQEILSLSEGNPPTVSMAEIIANLRDSSKGLERKPKKFDRHTGVLQVIDDVDYTHAREIQYGDQEGLVKAGPYIGPRGGRWADPQHTIPWDPEKRGRPAKIEREPVAPKIAVTTEELDQLRHLEGKLPGPLSLTEHVAIAKDFLERHKRALPTIVKAVAAEAGETAEMKFRVKELESALGKLVRKPDQYPTADKLQDGAGLRVVHDSVDQVIATVQKLKKQYRVVDEDDYITKPQGSYRSYHLILEDKKTGLQYEVQVRTRNQDTFADWAHNLYKPLTPEQEKAKEDPAVLEYESEMAEYFWALDNKESPPSKPDCDPPAIIRVAFGCL